MRTRIPLRAAAVSVIAFLTTSGCSISSGERQYLRSIPIPPEYDTTAPTITLEPWTFPQDPANQVVGSPSMAVSITAPPGFTYSSGNLTVRGLDSNNATVGTESMDIGALTPTTPTTPTNVRYMNASQVALILGVNTRTIEFTVTTAYTGPTSSGAASDTKKAPKPPAIVVRPWVCPPSLTGPIVLSIQVYPTPGTTFLAGSGGKNSSLYATGVDDTGKVSTAAMAVDPTLWKDATSYNIELSTELKSVLDKSRQIIFTLVVFYQNDKKEVDAIEASESHVKP